MGILRLRVGVRNGVRLKEESDTVMDFGCCIYGEVGTSAGFWELCAIEGCMDMVMVVMVMQYRSIYWECGPRYQLAQ